MTEVDHGEATALLAQATQACNRSTTTAPALLAARADTVDPNQPQTKRITQRILVEYGGELRARFMGH